MIEKRRQKQLAELSARIGRLRGQVLYLQQEEHLAARVLQTVARRWLVWDSVIKGAATRVLQRAVRRFLGRHRPGRQTGYQHFLAIQAMLGQDNDWSKLLTWALLTFESLGSVKANKKDTTRQQFNSVMIAACTLRGTHIRTAILSAHFSEESAGWPHRTRQLALSKSAVIWANSAQIFSENSNRDWQSYCGYRQ